MNDPGNIFDKNKPAHVEHPVNNPVNVPALKIHFTLFFGRFSIAKVINNKFIPTASIFNLYGLDTYQCIGYFSFRYILSRLESLSDHIRGCPILDHCCYYTHLSAPSLFYWQRAHYI